MKNKLKIFLPLFLLTFMSCEKWLDVEPKSEIKSETLFETTNGFKDALVGVYLNMTSTSLYGRDMTYGFVDILAQQYRIESNASSYYNTSKYQYEAENVKNYVSNVWSKAYNTLANINNLIDGLDKNKSKLDVGEYSILKGEALGLRAFIHFDLIRLFGASNLAVNKGSLSELTIPYLDKCDKNIPKQITLGKYLKNIAFDLQEADDLLIKYDPVSKELDPDYELPNSDKFYNDRQFRFNHVAVKALKARFYLWIGDRKNCLENTEYLIKKGCFSWVNPERINDSNVNAKDYTFSSEHIFRLNIIGFEEITKTYFTETENKHNYNLFSHTKIYADNLYQINTDGIGLSDYRFTMLYDKGKNYKFLKLSSKEDYNYKDMMPLIKKSEIYYMAAECYNKQGDTEKARKLLQEVRTHRGIVNKLSNDITSSELEKEIELEFRKEFICEGQLFFFYKRLGYKAIPGTPIPGDNKLYKLIMPDKEIEFGGRNK